MLDKLPKGAQARAKRSLQQIWMAENQAGAGRAFDHIVAAYEAKDEKEAECLVNDREAFVGVLRLPGRALVASEHDESGGERVCHCALADAEGTLVPEPEDGVCNGAAAGLIRPAEVAPSKRPKRLEQVIEGVQFRNGIQEVRRAA